MPHALPWALAAVLVLCGKPVAVAAEEVPGVVIAHFPASLGIYVGSPSIAILPSGDYIASHDGFGPNHKFGRTYFFRSKDSGASWSSAGQVERQGTSTLFVHNGETYLMGLGFGGVVIRRSTDEGASWSEPEDENTGQLLTDGPYHTAPTPVISHGGRIWRAMEAVVPPAKWARDYPAFMMSAPVDVDLLRADSWTSSDHVATNSASLGEGFVGWLEGNAVAAPDGSLAIVLRVHYYSMQGAQAAVVRVSQDGKSASVDADAGLIHFPGGAKKFTIRFDPVSSRYWSLTNAMPKRHIQGGALYVSGNAESTRNTLALVSSPDLLTWQAERIVLYHPDALKHGFQYADWQFQGHDIVAVSRTACDDGLGGADTMHNANYLTFHRVVDFRRPPSPKDPYAELLQEINR